MMQVIDPSVADESDPVLGASPSSTCTTRATAGARGPSRARYDRAWLARYRDAQRARVARLDAIARESIDAPQRAAEQLRRRSTRRATRRRGAHWRQRAVHSRVLVIYRTLADPAYLDLTIDPDDRPLGSLFAFPDPLDANYGRGSGSRAR